MAHLLLHGFLGSVEDWPSHIPGERIVYPDVTGQTFDAGIHTLLTHIKTTYGPGPHALTGYSMGGRLALSLAIYHPEIAHHLAMISASPGIQNPTERTARYIADQALANDLASSPLSLFLDKWYSQPLFEDLKASPEFQTLYQRRLTINPLYHANLLGTFSIGQQPSFWDQLHHLQCPLTLVTGTKDPKYTDIARQIVAQHPQTTWTQLPNVGHALLTRLQGARPLREQKCQGAR